MSIFIVTDQGQLVLSDTTIAQVAVPPSLFVAVFGTDLMLLATRAVVLLLLALVATAALAAIPTLGMYCCRFLRFSSLREQWRTPLPRMSSMRAKLGPGEFAFKSMEDKVRMNSKIDTRRSKQLNLLQNEVLGIASHHFRLARGTKMIGAMMVEIAGRLDQLEERGAYERNRPLGQRRRDSGWPLRSNPDLAPPAEADAKQSPQFGMETDWPFGEISEDEIIERRRHWFGLEAEIENIRHEYYVRSVEAGESPAEFFETYGEPRRIDVDAQVEEARREFRAISGDKPDADMTEPKTDTTSSAFYEPPLSSPPPLSRKRPG